jgi:PBSX family phage terminase large subunit
MPRKKVKEEPDRPYYISEDGKLDFDKIFKHQPKQVELLHTVTRNGVPYVRPLAPQCLSVGGIRSGKTTGWLMYFVQHYCMKYDGCDILVLRRTFKELESGAIADFKTFMPKELYTYDQTKHVATLINGSRVVFGHCQNNKERDIEQYLGQAYPGIVVDECGQFSPDAWQMLYSRNTVNASCKPDENGNLPVPAIVGCTNPLGPFYEYYRTVFVEKEPWQKPEDAKKDVEGAWWIPEAGTWRLIYEPKEYAHQRSTVLDNPQLLKRDPGIIARLNSLPKAKRDKMLLGLDGKFEGQYFDVWDPEYHVVNLREDPKAIIWQDYQPIWMGIDWGVQHITACYFFTRALVKNSVGDDYKTKVVCFQEIVSAGGKTNKELAIIIDSKAKLPNRDGKVKVNHIFFSHEKFSRQVSAHTPADEFSKELRPYGLPPVSRATTDRIGSASLMYNMMKNGDLVITDNCKDIILSIPSLMRDPDLLDDVLKVDAKGDDCYDGFRYGLFGMMSARKRPDIDIINEHAKQLDPLAAHFYRMKMLSDRVSANTPFVQHKQPQWQVKMNS